MENAQGRRAYILVFKTIKPLYVGTLTIDNSKSRRIEEKAAKN